ncbi:SRPBCC family protein [Streptomyces sp. NPDC050315]|uniref:SRPBCC family protein n=1 Tax=Streptomyces sp. NPDC050315 TaxID=3155039 RepID=UPI00343DA6CC
MLLTNTVPVKAPPDQVFALLNDVERVASCMPGAALGGQDGDAWQGRVTVKVGPITAAYAGTVRFLEADAGERRLRVQARGADTHGSGDAEAEVTLVVAEAPEGALLRLDTDLVIRGKIAQFGKGAIGAVSDRILQQFAQNLGSLLDQERVPAGPSPVPTAAGAQAPQAAPARAVQVAPAAPELDGLSMLAGPAVAKYGPVAAAFAFGLFEGWLLGRMAGLRRELKAVRRG